MMKKSPNIPLIVSFRRRTSVNTAVSEDVVEKVISHCFISAKKAMTDNNSVEISGFGRFLFNNKKAEKYIIKLEKEIVEYSEKLKNSLSEKERKTLEGRFRVASKNLKLLRDKLNDKS